MKRVLREGDREGVREREEIVTVSTATACTASTVTILAATTVFLFAQKGVI